MLTKNPLKKGGKARLRQTETRTSVWTFQAKYDDVLEKNRALNEWRRQLVSLEKALWPTLNCNEFESMIFKVDKNQSLINENQKLRERCAHLEAVLDDEDLDIQEVLDLIQRIHPTTNNRSGSTQTKLIAHWLTLFVILSLSYMRVIKMLFSFFLDKMFHFYSNKFKWFFTTFNFLSGWNWKCVSSFFFHCALWLSQIRQISH